MCLSPLASLYDLELMVVPKYIITQRFDLPMASQAEDWEFEPGVTPLSFLDFMCEIRLQIYHRLFGERKHREEICLNLRSISMVCAKFPNPRWARVGTPAQAVSN